jgi:hypothetical protein
MYPVVSPNKTGDGETGTYFQIGTGASEPILPSTEMSDAPDRSLK